MRIIIMGAGIIGATTAYFLAREGHEVVMIDKNPKSGSDCSFANGGQFSYSHIEPWSDAINYFKLFSNLVKPNSFISGNKIFSSDFIKWFSDFRNNSNYERIRKISTDLYSLTTYSHNALQEITLLEKDLDFDYQKNGILHFFRNKKNFEKEMATLEFKQSLKCNAKILNNEEIIKKEPSLIKLYDKNKLAGGVFYQNDATGNSYKLANQLTKICIEKYNLKFINDDIKNILTNGKKITAINCSREVIVGDIYISCLGAVGSKLLKGIKLNSKIYPLKGYSISIPTTPEFTAPKIAITDSENKIVYSRLTNIFRAAGTVDIAGFSSYYKNSNLKFITKNIKQSFSNYGDINNSEYWQGLRPFRPNSLPLICPVSKYPNLLLNMGHGSLGLTLAAGSAKIISNIVNKNDIEKKFDFLLEDEATIYQ